jgi:hypothetical protein
MARKKSGMVVRRFAFVTLVVLLAVGVFWENEQDLIGEDHIPPHVLVSFFQQRHIPPKAARKIALEFQKLGYVTLSQIKKLTRVQLESMGLTVGHINLVLDGADAVTAAPTVVVSMAAATVPTTISTAGPAPTPEPLKPTASISSSPPSVAAKAPQQLYRVNKAVTKALRIRSAPSVDRSVLKRIPAGSVVQGIKQENGWLQVSDIRLYSIALRSMHNTTQAIPPPFVFLLFFHPLFRACSLLFWEGLRSAVTLRSTLQSVPEC